MPEVKMGIYRHYKGPLYQVIGLAHDANDERRTCVVYMPLQLNGAHLGPRMAVRTLEDFVARVHKDGSTCDPGHCGHNWARFLYLGPVLTDDMLAGDPRR